MSTVAWYPRILITSISICAAKIILFPQIRPDLKYSTLFIQVTAAVFAIWSFYKVFIYPSWISPLRNLPKPKGAYPLIGFPKISFRQGGQETMLEAITDTPNDGLLRVPGFFNQDSILLTSPATLQEVLSTKTYDFEKPRAMRDFLRVILGDGLVVVESDVHKFQRKNLTPAFHFRHIKELYPVFWSKSSDFVKRIASEIHANPESFDEKKSKHPESVLEINTWANKMAMDSIGVAGLGRDFNTIHNSEDELVKAYELLTEPTKEKLIFFACNIVLSPKVVAALPWKLNETLKKTTDTLRDTCRQLVREKKQLIRNDKDTKDVDILSILIKSNNFGDDQLVDQLLTFLAAGHETTASVFTWGTYLLSINPNIQTNLRAEICAALPSPDSLLDPSFDLASTLESLPLLHGVCAEILRLYPTVPVTTRVAVCDTSISGTFVPAGTVIWLSPWATNRSVHLWGDNAADFVPERWIDSATGKLNNHGGVQSNYANLTFLHGPRSCIGEKFAKAEMRCLLAAFVGSYQMAMADPNEVPVVAGAITSKPRNGMRLRLQKVEGWD